MIGTGFYVQSKKGALRNSPAGGGVIPPQIPRMRELFGGTADQHVDLADILGPF